MTPVHVAAAWGRLNILQLLLANGGDPLCLDNDGHSPFHFAFDGKYFKALTLLSDYCLTFQNEDNKPKFNIALGKVIFFFFSISENLFDMLITPSLILNVTDKVLVTNGDVVAEYIASKEKIVNLNENMTEKNTLDFYNCKPNSSSMIVDTSHVTYLCNNTIETKFILPDNVNKYSFKHSETAQFQDNHSETDTREISNYSFIDLDFDFANLHLSDAVEKEKCLVSQIINQLSFSVNNCKINETLNIYKRNNQRERSVTNNSSTSYQLKENEDIPHKYKYYKTSESILHKRKKKCVKDISQSATSTKTRCSKQSTSKKKHKEVVSKTPLTPIYVFDNSIISMSPNFKTPNQGTKRNIVNTSPLINDDIISMSPNFMTSKRTNKRLHLKKRISIDDSCFQEMLKHSQKYKNQIQQSEYNLHRKRIAQSTPRKKRRSIYKYSRRQIFHTYRYESDVITDEVSGNNRFKSLVDLNKTIFSEVDILDTSNECLSINLTKHSKSGQENNDNNNFTIHFDNEKYNQDINTDPNLVNLNNSFSQIEKKNSVNYFSGNKYMKSENTQVNDKFVTIRKNIFKTNKDPKAIDISPKKSASITKPIDLSHREEFVDCVDCDTKKLLNEDLNVNISKICNVHAKNWCSDKLPETLSHKLNTQACSLSQSRILLSKLNKQSIDFKKTEDIFKVKDSNIFQSERNS